MKRALISVFISVLIIGGFQPVSAQENQADGPVYVVQAGDSLWGIAARFGISMDDLADTNGIADPGQLSIGARLVIPGFEGLSGVLAFQTVPVGENIDSLSHRYHMPREALLRLNRFTSPADAYAGSQLIVIEQEGDEQTAMGGRATLGAEQSLMETAIRRGSSPWTLMKDNQMRGSWDLLPGENLYLTSDDLPVLGALPEFVDGLEVNPFPLIQGHTLVIDVNAPQVISLEGKFHDRPLNFFQSAEGSFVALQGIHAMLEPGAYPITLEGATIDGTPLSFSQNVFVQDGDYLFDPPLVVDSETTDIQNNETENELWFDVVAPVTTEKFWDGLFQSPVPESLSDCFPSVFGNRRSYNQSGYYYFHSGLDFCGRPGVEIYAPAPGKVVFTGPLTVRGNATVIDHGRGVYSAYAHQSEIAVSEGAWVETGQVIGLVGETGRVTGPHLHWEIIVGGVQVDPQYWFFQEYP